MSIPFQGQLRPRLAALADTDWHEVTIGKSEASVWKISRPGQQTLFLKTAPVHALSELPGEADRMIWLRDRGVPAPEVVDRFEHHGQHVLLVTGLPGADLTHYVDRPDDLASALAQGLRALHALDLAGCPFGYRLDARLVAGAANIAAGLVDESDFDTDRQGWTAAEVLDWLHQNRPADEDLVVVHGDASLPNLLADDGVFSGVIDIGRLGVSDRWQDLAIACRSIIFNCGAERIPDFLEAYGAEWDEARYRYYCTLDELF